MPLFAAVISALRRRKRANVATMRMTVPPLWRLLAEEVFEAGRALRHRFTT